MELVENFENTIETLLTDLNMLSLSNTKQFNDRDNDDTFSCDTDFTILTYDKQIAQKINNINKIPFSSTIKYKKTPCVICFKYISNTNISKHRKTHNIKLQHVHIIDNYFSS